MIEQQRGSIFVRERVALESLQQLLKLNLPWAYVASLSEAKIVACTPELPQNWLQGRAFGPSMEVRWRREAIGFVVELLTEQTVSALPEGEWQQLSPEIDGLASRTLLLWGERGEAASNPWEWVTIRIPRALRYPIDVAELSATPSLLRVNIQAYDYTIAAQPVATRWLQLLPTTAHKED